MAGLGKSNAVSGITKFWKQVSVVPKVVGQGLQNNTKLEIQLDGRSLRTPGGRHLWIPVQQTPLAYLIAGEWESQKDSLKSYSLPLTSLAARAVDEFNGERSQVIQKLLNYLNTDAICYHQPFPESFAKMQNDYWKYILDWLRNERNLPIQSTEGVLAIQQPEKVHTFFKNYLNALSDFQLAGYERSVISTKSILISFALFERKIDVAFAAKAGRLEVLHQIEKWGEVEDSHDTDREELQRQLGAVSTLLLEQEIESK